MPKFLMVVLGAALVLVTSAATSTPATSAPAAPGCSYSKKFDTRYGGGVAGESQAQCNGGGGKSNGEAAGGGSGGSATEGAAAESEPAAPTAEELAERYRQQLMAFHSRLAAWQECVGSSISYGTGGERFDESGAEMVCGGAPTAPQSLGPDGANAAQEVTAAIPAEQLAYLAAARLTLPELTLGIGPDPAVNRWNKAFVGVEYWFWARGSTTVAPVGQSVGPVSVRLSATVEKLTVKTGDSNGSVTCTGPGSAWRAGTDLQTPSPSCGQRFTTVGERRIVLTATWAVEWTINGQSGVIRLQRSSARDVEVSELHAVTR